MKVAGDGGMKIAHWTIKVTWEDEHGNPADVQEEYEYINDIPDWVAKPVDEYIDKIEEEMNNDEFQC